MASKTSRKPNLFFVLISFCALATLLKQFNYQNALGSNPADVSLSGKFTIIWGDGEPGTNQTAITYLLTSDSGQKTRLLIADEIIASLGGITSLRNQFVTVEGKLVHNTQQNDEIMKVQVSSIEPSLNNTPSDLFITSGPWVSILCKFADIATEPQPPSYFQGMYSNSYPGLDHYWRESTRSEIVLEGSQAWGWYTLPQPRSYYVYDENNDGSDDLDFERITTDCTAIAEGSIYFPNYVGINLMFNDELDGPAWGGSYNLTLDGTYRFWPMTWLPPWGYNHLTVVTHEMGHGFGLPHSAVYGYPYGFGQGNRWDVMGNGWEDCSASTHPVYGCLGQHTIAYHRGILGSITPAEIYFPVPGQTATITIEQLTNPQNSGYLMAQIPIGNSSTHFYTVETRRKVGYDIKLPGQGIIIHNIDITRPEPAHLIDIDYNGNTGDSGTIWLPGETFVDQVNGITIRVDSSTPTGFVVTIEIAGHGNNTYVPLILKENIAPQPTPTATYMPTPTPTPTPVSSNPPTSPSNVQAISTSPTTIQLTWNDNSNNESGFYIHNGYYLVTTTNQNVTSYTVTGLEPNTWYCHRIAAFNAAGQSPWTDWACTFTLPVPSLPAPPSNLQATATGPTTIQLTWNDNSNNESGFYIHNGFYLVTTTGQNITSYTVTGLEPYTWYCHRVAAFNSAGESAWTDWACTSTLFGYFDDFSDVNSGWPNEYDIGYEDGTYQIINQNDNTWIGVVSPFVGSIDYTVEADMWLHSGSPVRYGVIFDWLDWSNFYLFSVNPTSQVYSLERVTNQNWTTIASSTSSHIFTGNATNHLAVTKLDTFVEIRINGQSHGIYAGGEFIGNLRVGLFTKSGNDIPVTARFDNLSIVEVPTGNPHQQSGHNYNNWFNFYLQPSIYIKRE
jgi:hypothetical protein